MKSAVTHDRVTVRCERLAMATRFEFFLVGDDREHLIAVGEAALDEISRIDRLLSRFDPASEVSRINREAASLPVRVDRELFGILLDCHIWCGRTRCYFNVCANDGADSPRFGGTVQLNLEDRTIRFLDPTTRLDFGGYGKGYALDAAGRVLDEFGVRSALLHGGTSSILIRGRQADGSPWRVGLRDPFSDNPGVELARLDLPDCGFSSSAVFHHNSTRSDLVDPIKSRSLDRQAACSVVSPTAQEAEVLSTAFLLMGKELASLSLASFQDSRAAWIERVGNAVEVEWIGEGGMP